MSKKLFELDGSESSYKEEIATESSIAEIVENSDVGEVIKEYRDDLELACEGFKRASEELFLVRDIKTALESKRVSSVEYFTSIENFNLYLRSISNNLGIEAKIPSMEDFKNPYGIETSHKIVMEGFKDVIRSIWAKIKEFFKAFYKKIKLFFKRLLNLDLELDEYERYTEKLITKLKSSNKDTAESVKIDSKLPVLLADPEMVEVHVDYVLDKGEEKIGNLVDITKSVTTKRLPSLVKDITRNISVLKDLLKSLEGYKDTSELVEGLSILRENFNNKLIVDVFDREVNIAEITEEVTNKFYYFFDRTQIDNEDFNVYSVLSEKQFKLPKGIDIYLAISDFNAKEDLRTSKLYIVSGTEVSTQVSNTISTIKNKENIIALYDFYKKFSKELNVKDIQRRMDGVSREIDTIIRDLDRMFSAIAIEGRNDDSYSAFDMDDELTRSLVRDDLGFGESEEGEVIEGTVEGDGSEDISDGASIDKKELFFILNTFQKYLLSYLNSIQSLLKEINLSLLGTHFELRRELIRLIYYSAKQF